MLPHTHLCIMLQSKTSGPTYISTCVCSVTQLCPTLCDPMDCSPSGSTVHGISQARILEWVAISFSRGSSRPSNQTRTSSFISCIAGRFLTTEPPAVQLPSCVRLSATPWTAARQAFLFITNSQSLLKLMSIELVMPFNHLLLCCPRLLLPSLKAAQ